MGKKKKNFFFSHIQVVNTRNKELGLGRHTQIPSAIRSNSSLGCVPEYSFYYAAHLSYIVNRMCSTTHIFCYTNIHNAMGKSFYPFMHLILLFEKIQKEKTGSPEPRLHRIGPKSFISREDPDQKSDFNNSTQVNKKRDNKNDLPPVQPDS